MTARQRSMYWRTFQAACLAMGIASDKREEYRKMVMQEEAGVSSTRELDNAGLDKVLARFSADAGDWQSASRFVGGDVRRAIALVEDVAVQVLLLAGKGTDAPAYIAGILRQSQIAGRVAGDGTFLLDIPGDSVIKVFQMLDTHRRRLLRRHGCERVAYHMGDRRVVAGDLVIPAPYAYAYPRVEAHAVARCNHG